ncbi:Isochorismatase [Ephemeroptericola cinctiostellae]|uniref:isochorismatase n=1 Tax=Ephemeroptericola cinctiostellae TaxID=2268024 RepID=A0A345DB61_9BURK|nr:isochorismatase family protein [Ephemeroptericola cinctiostellae]AXF85599.1 Isochorismatase [Ephemeroptericola cinctiostellae]
MSIPRISSYPMPSASNVPQAKLNWRCDAKRAVLLIHDMQSYFVNFFDASKSPIPELLSNIARIKSVCKALGVPVVYSAQPAQQSLLERGILQEWWGNGVTAFPEQVDIVPELSPSEGDVVLTKWRYSAFSKSTLASDMQAQQRDQLIICGVYAHIGCQTTAVEAFMRDMQVFFVADGVADFSFTQHEEALAYVSRCCGIVQSTAQLLSVLQPETETDALPRNLVQLTAQVARLIEIPVADLEAEDNLIFAGLDSIRLMSLVERWKRSGSRLDFVDLAQKTTLNEWWALLQGQSVQQFERNEN